MVQQSATALWIIFFCFPESVNSTVVAMLGVLLGIYWAVSANLTVEPCQELTEGGGFAIGHQQMFGVWLTDIDPDTAQSGRRAEEAKDPQPTPSQRKHQNDLVRKLNNAGKGRASRKGQ